MFPEEDSWRYNSDETCRECDKGKKQLRLKPWLDLQSLINCVVTEQNALCMFKQYRVLLSNVLTRIRERAFSLVTKYRFQSHNKRTSRKDKTRDIVPT